MSASLTDAAIAAGTTPDPFELFTQWLEEAWKSEPNDANAMTLATVDAGGLPDARIVLLKGHDADGFVFYTNRESAKGLELRENPKAALLFHWKTLGRQVRVRGAVSLVSDAESDAYYATRPLLSRIGAWASDQSRPAENRKLLEKRVAEREAEFGEEPPRPPHWGGYRITPEAIEFWQAGEFRLHDRFVYRRDGAGYTVQRLFP
ncbi:pyridoxamine 5'-phosphate oxidase [Acuticoccus sediminis]|uniref:Pyridoxine/pyridoxamine 5'-phosphate oxidase n=1 Tax=Acuticoccus sediminis TaxID=2184697 RepID=A0A8B2NLL6_9HYPH|nr:pyridoxamine 5'-phosphate oxidase [Acuticoccus sediminis]RAI00566.1 pyridoxamine 5'-phosphate oxidase [Acuticoccus sediminis]